MASPPLLRSRSQSRMVNTPPTIAVVPCDTSPPLELEEMLNSNDDIQVVTHTLHLRTKTPVS